jgi:HK97 gp10 family phage protein
MTTSNIDSFVSSIEAMKAAMLAKGQEAIRAIGEDIQKNAQDNLMLNDSYITGNLYDSIQPEYFDDGEGQFRVEVWPHEEYFTESGIYYAYTVEFGRGEVLPVTKKVLHWFDPKTGLDVFAKRSKPADPKPYMAPAVSQTAGSVIGLVTPILSL